MSDQPDVSLDEPLTRARTAPEGSDAASPAQAQEPADGRGSVTLNLPQATKDLVTREGRESLSAAVRGLIRDRISLFEMPRPARLVLERDMEQQGITDQRDYVIWLLLERHRHILGQGRAR